MIFFQTNRDVYNFLILKLFLLDVNVKDLASDKITSRVVVVYSVKPSVLNIVVIKCGSNKRDRLTRT